MDSPQNQIWGPNLWMILHFSAERIGLSPIKKLPYEESRIWLGLLGSLRYSLPCPQCKKHYTEYFSANPLQKLVTQDMIRTWLYNLHSLVNSKTEKQNTITIEQIPEIYSKPFHFTSHYNIVIEHMQRSIRVGWSSREYTQKTIRLLQELKRFYDFF